jgi:hypothetical protein
MLAIEHAKIRKICCIDENAQFQEATPVGLQTWAPRLVLMPNVKPSRRHPPWKRMTLMPVDLRPRNDSSLRREEAAAVQHGKLRMSSYGTLERPVWELTMIDKRNKGRTVPVSIATLGAFKAHRSDRGRDFMVPTVLLSPSAPLLSPVPSRARPRHVPCMGSSVTSEAKRAGLCGRRHQSLDLAHVDDHRRGHG